MSSKLWCTALLSSVLLSSAAQAGKPDSKSTNTTQVVAPLTNVTSTNGDIVELNDSNTVVLNQEVTSSSISKVLSAAIEKSGNLPPGQPLYLFIDSPGGSIVAGLDLIQGLAGLGREVKTVTSFSASMAFITVQSLGERIVMPSGVLMSHHAAGGVEGNIPGNIDTRYNFWKKFLDDALIPVAKRLGMSVEELHQKDEKEWWTSGPEAIAQHTADTVKLVRCDKSMSGSYVEQVNTMFGPVTVTYAKCPLIKAPLAVSFGNVHKETMSVFEIRDLEQSVHEYLYNKEDFAEDYMTNPHLREMFK